MAEHSSLLEDGFILLGFALVFVLAFRRMGLGATLGYLLAGIVIGPFGLGLIYSVYQVEAILHFAEFGVVLLLFIIGLELSPKRLWVMRKAVFGVGLAYSAAELQKPDAWRRVGPPVGRSRCRAGPLGRRARFGRCRIAGAARGNDRQG